jgi:hypothetical protein
VTLDEPDAEPVPSSILTETVATPVGEEVVFPGWNTRPTVQMQSVDPVLLAACRDLPKTVPSMRAVVPPSERAKGSL